jgi:hypothetical protein
MPESDQRSLQLDLQREAFGDPTLQLEHVDLLELRVPMAWGPLTQHSGTMGGGISSYEDQEDGADEAERPATQAFPGAVPDHRTVIALSNALSDAGCYVKRAACRGETSGREGSSPCRIADLLAMSAEGRPSPWSPAIAPLGQPEESLEQATVGPVATGGANRSEVTYSDTACVCGNMTTPVLVLMAHVRRMSDL